MKITCINVNLHLSYIGSGNFIQFYLRTVSVQYKIFRVDNPLDVDIVNMKPVLGSLTSDEEETLKTLLDQGLDDPKTVHSTKPKEATSASFGSQ